MGDERTFKTFRGFSGRGGGINAGKGTFAKGQRPLLLGPTGDFQVSSERGEVGDKGMERIRF